MTEWTKTSDLYAYRVLSDGSTESKLIAALAEGDALVEVPVVKGVASCTAWQIRKALNAAGLREQVETAIAAGPQEEKDGWEFATEFLSSDPFVLAMGARLNFSPEQVREFILQASTL